MGAQQYSRVLRRTRAPNELPRRPGQVQLDAVVVRVLGVSLQRSGRQAEYSQGYSEYSQGVSSTGYSACSALACSAAAGAGRARLFGRPRRAGCVRGGEDFIGVPVSTAGVPRVPRRAHVSVPLRFDVHKAGAGEPRRRGFGRIARARFLAAQVRTHRMVGRERV
jgi:hypothetical protein